MQTDLYIKLVRQLIGQQILMGHRSRVCIALFALIILIPRAQGGPCDSIFLFNGPEFSFGEVIYMADSADFDGDGTMDMMVLGSSGLSIMLGNGDGTLGQAQILLPDMSIRYMALADLDEDGFSDVIVSTIQPSKVLVLMGRGDGSFEQPVEYGTGNHPSYIEIGDINGDGVLDVLTGNLNESSISILLGVGDGSLESAYPMEVGDRPSSIAIGDIDHDGVSDLAIITGSQGRVNVFVGTGGGGFAPVVTYPVQASPRNLIFTDYNADGFDDLLVVNYTSNSLSMLAGRSDGTLESAVSRPVGDRPELVGVSDLNSDGYVDIVVTNSRSDDVSVFLGNANGVLPNSIPFAAGYQPRSINQADYTADGVMDIMVTNQKTFTLLVGDGTGLYAAETSPTGNFYRSKSVVVGDLNEDGLSDIVIPNYTTNGFVSVLLAQSEGTYASDIQFASGNYPSYVAIADFDQDKVQDILVINDYMNQLNYLKGLADGSFESPISSDSPAYRVFGLDIGDVNGDGLLDVVVGGSSGASVMLGNGDGTFIEGNSYLNGNYLIDIKLRDMNGDGYLDIILLRVSSGSGVGTVQILTGNGDGTFVEPLFFYPSGPTSRSMAIGDINEDTIPDIVVSNTGDGLLSILMGTSNGIFGLANPIELGYAPFGITMGDLNLDGHLDIAFASIGTQNAGTLLGNGDGSFSQSQNYGAGYGAMFIVMDDLDADGDQDLVVLNEFDSYYESKNLSVLLNRLDPPPACRADITRDGVLNFFDISAFLDLLGAHDPIADITDDCRYNFFDISAFLQLYAAGCP